MRTLGNTQAGIVINGDTNQVGGLTPGAANVIQFNGGAGVTVTSGSRNTISGNRIFNNGGLAIDLGLNSGVTPNDPDDADIGESYLQNFPVLTAAASAYGSTTVQGSLSSAAASAYRIEFFASPACDAAGLAEGQIFLGSTNVTTDASGNVSFAALLPIGTPTNFLVTATATSAAGDTSEFSAGTAATIGPQGVSLAITAGVSAPMLTWTGEASDYWLEATDSLDPTSQWRQVISGVVNAGAGKNLSLTNAAAKPSEFFRLRKF